MTAVKALTLCEFYVGVYPRQVRCGVRAICRLTANGHVVGIRYCWRHAGMILNEYREVAGIGNWSARPLERSER